MRKHDLSQYICHLKRAKWHNSVFCFVLFFFLIVIKILDHNEIIKQWSIYTMKLLKQKIGFLILIRSLSSKQAVNVV